MPLKKNIIYNPFKRILVNLKLYKLLPYISLKKIVVIEKNIIKNHFKCVLVKFKSNNILN